MYCILWNQSQVASWIEEMLDNDYYNETLVLETMEPVDKDKDVSKLGTDFTTHSTKEYCLDFWDSILHEDILSPLCEIYGHNVGI